MPKKSTPAPPAKAAAPQTAAKKTTPTPPTTPAPVNRKAKKSEVHVSIESQPEPHVRIQADQPVENYTIQQAIQDMNATTAAELLQNDPGTVDLTPAADGSFSISPALYQPYIAQIDKLRASLDSDKKLARVEAQLVERNQKALESLRNFTITDDVGAQIIGGVITKNSENKKMAEELLGTITTNFYNLYVFTRDRRDKVLKVCEQIDSAAKRIERNWLNYQRELEEAEKRRAEQLRIEQEARNRREAEERAAAEKERIRLQREADMEAELLALPEDASDEQLNTILAKYDQMPIPVVVVQPAPMPPPPQVMSVNVPVPGISKPIENYEFEITDAEAFIKHIAAHFDIFNEFIEFREGRIKTFINITKLGTNIPGIRVYRDDNVRRTR